MGNSPARALAATPQAAKPPRAPTAPAPEAAAGEAHGHEETAVDAETYPLRNHEPCPDAESRREHPFVTGSESIAFDGHVFLGGKPCGSDQEFAEWFDVIIMKLVQRGCAILS